MDCPSFPKNDGLITTPASTSSLLSPESDVDVDVVVVVVVALLPLPIPFARPPKRLFFDEKGDGVDDDDGEEEQEEREGEAEREQRAEAVAEMLAVGARAVRAIDDDGEENNRDDANDEALALLIF
jgi:hypothetical protein